MTEVDNTHFVLCCFLRALSVKVSRSTLSHLLDTPVGSSMRGISDALDALRIRNEVYQLPPTAEYFSQVEAPFITMLQVDKNPFRVVTKKTDSIVEFGNSGRMSVDKFLKMWTGTVLFGETTEETQSEKFYLWKDVFYYLSKYKVVISILLVIVLGLFSSLRQNAPFALTAYLGTLAFGILVSVAIIYKEQFNRNFMERFCHIGKTVDCNTVLRSKGASIAGASLGELSLLYFGTLFMFCTFCLTDFYGIALFCNAVALCFTLYSIIYQIFIIQKGCMLCMLTNITIWINTLILLLQTPIIITFTLASLFRFMVSGLICCIFEVVFNNYRKEYKEKSLLEERFSTLLKPEVFHKLLELEPQIKGDLSYIDNIAINNLHTGKNRLLVITNPNCRNCAIAHFYIKELALKMPLSLLLLTYPNDSSGKWISEVIMAAYRQDGWEKAISLLEEWFRKHKIKESEKYLITSEIEDLRKKQLIYCWQQGIRQTPTIIINKYHLPEVYPLSSLKYVLT